MGENARVQKGQTRPMIRFRFSFSGTGDNRTRYPANCYDPCGDVILRLRGAGGPEVADRVAKRPMPNVSMENAVTKVLNRRTRLYRTDSRVQILSGLY
jgi:hypothetical protein